MGKRYVLKSINGKPHKLCRGPLHPEDGAWVPVTSFRTRTAKSDKAPRLRGWCSPCEHALKNKSGNPRMIVGWVEVESFMPMIREIENRIGRTEAIRRVDVSKHTWYSWLDKSRLRAQRATMLKVERVFKELEKTGETRSQQSIKRGRQARGEEVRPEASNGGWSRPEVVPCWQLSNVLRAWYDNWRRERPNYMREYNMPGSRQFYSPLTWLSEASGIPVRTINAYIRNERKYVILENVDAILQAIDKTDLLQTEITVIPNPRWTLEKYTEYMAARGCV